MTDTHTKPRKRRGRTFWQGHVDAWQSFGGSQSDYCRQNQLSERLFSIWKNKFTKEAATQPTEDKVEFMPVSIGSPNESAAPGAESVSIHLPNGIYLQASLSSSGQHLAELVKNLVPIPC